MSWRSKLRSSSSTFPNRPEGSRSVNAHLGTGCNKNPPSILSPIHVLSGETSKDFSISIRSKTPTSDLSFFLRFRPPFFLISCRGKCRCWGGNLEQTFQHAGFLFTNEVCSREGGSRCLSPFFSRARTLHFFLIDIGSPAVGNGMGGRGYIIFSPGVLLPSQLFHHIGRFVVLFFDFRFFRII